MKKCNNCNGINRDKDRYCRNCGWAMKKNGYYILLNVLTILVFIGLMFVITLFIASYFVY